MSETKKVIKRINELIEKALNGGGLNKKEMDELKGLLRKTRETSKENAKAEDKKLSEIAKENFSMLVPVVLGEHALEVAMKKYNESLPLKERMNEMESKLDQIDLFYQKNTPKLQAEAEKLKKKQEEAQLYAEYEKKHNYPL